MTERNFEGTLNISIDFKAIAVNVYSGGYCINRTDPEKYTNEDFVEELTKIAKAHLESWLCQIKPDVIEGSIMFDGENPLDNYHNVDDITIEVGVDYEPETYEPQIPTVYKYIPF